MGVPHLATSMEIMESYGNMSQDEIADRFSKCRDYIQFFLTDDRWTLHCATLSALLEEFDELRRFSLLRE